MNSWIDKTITINDSWGPGAADVLQVPLAVSPEFTMRAQYLRDAQGDLQLSQLQSQISSGYLSDGWRSTLFTPLGTIPVAGISGLPPWDPSQAQVYRDLIEGPDNNLGDSRTTRLEGVIPYVDSNGAVGYDTVRLFYAFNAVTGGPYPDLVIIKTATLVAIPGTVQVRQDGGGHGPPH